MRIPIYQPDLSGKESTYVQECLDSSWISSKGSFVEKFESGFSDFTGIPHAVSVSNGTVALHVALLALGIGAGDEVIVPTFTYIASVNAIAYTGAKPVFVDSLGDSWQMDPADVSRKVTENTKAVMAVHLYGHPCDMEVIMAIAEDNNLQVVEDCAEAIGSLYKNKHVGTFGDIATFSFFGNKTITTGEGGMVLSGDKELIARVRKLKGQGLAENREYWHDVIGYNYRLTNIAAAIGTAQLERINTFLESKIKLAATYRQGLGEGITFHEPVGDVTHSYWMSSILVDDANKRDGLREHLKAEGIETRPLFFPIHTMPIYLEEGDFPIAMDLSRRGINLPSWPGLKADEIAFISDRINGFMDAHNG